MNPGLLGLGAALAWGTGDYIARFSGRAVGPDRLTLVVVGASVLLLAPLALWQGVAPLLQPIVLGLCAVAGVSTALSLWLLFMVLARGPVGVVSPLLASYPVPLVLYAHLNWDFAPSAAMYGAIATTLIGVWTVARAGHKTQHKEGHALGSIGVTIALSLMAIVCFDVTVIAIREATAFAGELAVIWGSRMVAFPLVALAFVIRGKPLGLTGKWWTVLLIQGVLDTSGGVMLFWGQSGVGTTIATVVSSAYGAVTVGLARSHLKEVISPLQLVGTAMVLGGAAALSALS